MKYIKIAENLYTTDYNIMDVLAKELGLPSDIECCHITEDGYLARTVTVYHNRVEDDILQKDPEKVELAKAFMLIKKHLTAK